jgi:hypothetical protein
VQDEPIAPYQPPQATHTPAGERLTAPAPGKSTKNDKSKTTGKGKPAGKEAGAPSQPGPSDASTVVLVPSESLQPAAGDDPPSNSTPDEIQTMPRTVKAAPSAPPPATADAGSNLNLTALGQAADAAIVPQPSLVPRKPVELPAPPEPAGPPAEKPRKLKVVKQDPPADTAPQPKPKKEKPPKTPKPPKEPKQPKPRPADDAPAADQIMSATPSSKVPASAGDSNLTEHERAAQAMRRGGEFGDDAPPSGPGRSSGSSKPQPAPVRPATDDEPAVPSFESLPSAAAPDKSQRAKPAKAAPHQDSVVLSDPTPGAPLSAPEASTPPVATLQRVPSSDQAWQPASEASATSDSAPPQSEAPATGTQLEPPAVNEGQPDAPGSVSASPDEAAAAADRAETEQLTMLQPTDEAPAQLRPPPAHPPVSSKSNSKPTGKNARASKGGKSSKPSKSGRAKTEPAPLIAPQPLSPQLGALQPAQHGPAGGPTTDSDPFAGKPGLMHLTDDFSKQRWPVQNNQGSVYSYDHGAYVIDNRQAENVGISYQDERLDGVRLDAAVDYLDGPSYVGYGCAVRFRIDGGQVSYYAMFVTNAGECLLLKVQDGQESVLSNYKACPAYKPGQTNVLRLEAVGGKLRAYVNGELAQQADDSSLAPGGYALLAGAGVKVRYDKLELVGLHPSGN